MRKVLFSLIAAALFGMASVAMTTPAGALPLPAAGAIKGAMDTVDVTESVRCWRVWRCGPYGCGWRVVCSRPRYVYPYYSPYSVYRPHWRHRHHHWRHRHWRRW